MESGKFVQVVTKPTPITWKTAEKIQSVETETLPLHNGGELTQFTSKFIPIWFLRCKPWAVLTILFYSH